ncbi:MAG: glycoside hydrolase family 15 protein, partial [Chloroflexi bacterium]|nr:glycoside hydrolase family 15 protein [Chloroflexota bacterium]
MGYQPIENYGIIGDMRTAALVGMNGSIDWFCIPNFDSPSVFAAILDDQKGGRFQIAPVGDDWDSKQFYLPETNILVTRFLSDEGVAEIVDYMPVAGREEEGAHHVIVRKVTGVRGLLRLRMVCKPAFDYAREEHIADVSEYGVIFRTSKLTIGMFSSVPLESGDGMTSSEFTLREGGTATFVLGELDEGSRHPLVLLGYGDDDHFNRTADYWRGWLSGCTYTGRWREQVHRSALVLKLLTHADTGAVIAAATTSLPEVFGGVRNWDYRYTWIRDASFTIYALLRIGLGDAATGFMGWIEDRCRELNPDGSLQLMYGIDGRHELPEQELDHLEGYRNSKPVRI